MFCPFIVATKTVGLKISYCHENPATLRAKLILVSQFSLLVTEVFMVLIMVSPLMIFSLFLFARLLWLYMQTDAGFSAMLELTKILIRNPIVEKVHVVTISIGLE